MTDRKRVVLTRGLRFCERFEKPLLLAVFVLALLIRLRWLGSDFNITADLSILRSWIGILQEHGLVAFYEQVGERAYPPLSTYLLAAAAWLSSKLSQSAVVDQTLLNALIKLPAILADLATAVLLVTTVAARKTAVWRLLVAALYLLNPAVWYVSIYWGQTDSIYVFFLVAALLLLARGAVVPAWLCYGLSLAVKLQGLPLVILFVVWTLVNYGSRALVRGLAAAVGLVILLMLPWLLNGRQSEVTEAIFNSSTRLVQSAYNGWYFLLRDRAGIAEAGERSGILSFSYQTVSLFLFSIVALAVIILIIRRKNQLSLPITAVILSLAAFLFLPDMRERYLFPILPLLLWAVSQQRTLLWLYLILTATWLFNLVTIASFAPQWWINLVAWQPPYPAHIGRLKDIAWLVSAVHLMTLFWLVWFLAKRRPAFTALPAHNRVRLQDE